MYTVLILSELTYSQFGFTAFCPSLALIHTHTRSRHVRKMAKSDSNTLLNMFRKRYQQYLLFLATLLLQINIYLHIV